MTRTIIVDAVIVAALMLAASAQADPLPQPRLSAPAATALMVTSPVDRSACRARAPRTRCQSRRMARARGAGSQADRSACKAVADSHHRHHEPAMKLVNEAKSRRIAQQ